MAPITKDYAEGMRDGTNIATSSLAEVFESHPDEEWTGASVAAAIRSAGARASLTLEEFTV